MEPLENPSYIAIARIVRTRGNRGEVLVELYTDFVERFDHLTGVWLEFADHRRKHVLLEQVWLHGDRLVLKFSGVNSISAAEGLVGAWVEVEADQAVELPEGAYFDHDLIGCLVKDPEGEDLGKVVDILRIASNNQLVVQVGSSEYLIPATEEICKRISITEKQILVDLPEGLMDLNK